MIECRYASVKAGTDFWMYLLIWSEVSDVRWKRRRVTPGEIQSEQEKTERLKREGVL